MKNLLNTELSTTTSTYMSLAQLKIKHQNNLINLNNTTTAEQLCLSQPKDEIQELLFSHAQKASMLANLVVQVEGQTLAFATDPQYTSLLVSTLGLIERFEKLRAGIVSEIQRTAILYQEVASESRVHLTLKDSSKAAVLLEERTSSGNNRDYQEERALPCRRQLEGV